MAAVARLEDEQLPHADYAAHRSLEALRLEDPAILVGCWNPGCAAAFATAGLRKNLDLEQGLSVHKQLALDGSVPR